MQQFYANTDQFFKLKIFENVLDEITEDTHVKVRPIIEKYTKKQLTYVKSWIVNFIVYKFEDNWSERFDKIFDTRNDTASLDAYILRWGEFDGPIKYDEKCSHTRDNKKKYIQKHGEDAWYNKVQNRPKYSLESQIKFYGEEEGTRRWNLMLSTKLQNEKINSENSDTPRKNGQSLEEYQERYGIEDGYNRWRKRYDHMIYMNSKQRYIDEYGEDEGSKICRDIKANLTIERFIEKYGDVDGPKRFEIAKSNCGITLEKMISKYGEEEGTYKYNLWRTATRFVRNGKTYSKSSQVLFWAVYEQLEDKYKSLVYFAELNEEQIIFVPEHLGYSRYCFFPDFKCNNVIIEFDCVYWHDPIKDQERDIIANKMGFTILRIDYEDHRRNPITTIKKCIDFIYEKTQIE